MSHYHIPPSCASPLTARVNNGSILESCLWLGACAVVWFPQLHQSRRWRRQEGAAQSGNSSAWAGSTFGGPLCQPHLPLTRKKYKSVFSSWVEIKLVTNQLWVEDYCRDRRRIRRKSKNSKNWTTAMPHSKREVSPSQGTESMKPPWNLPACKCVLMCKVGHLFGAGTAVVCLSGAMSEQGIVS